MPEEDDMMDMNDDDLDLDPIPAKRDLKIFARKKEEDKKVPDKEEEFDEDIFV